MSERRFLTPAAPYLSACDAPPHLVAIFEVLRLDQPSAHRLRSLGASDWENLLEWCDARQLTLMLPWLCVDALPDVVRRRIGECQRRYSERFSRLKRDLFEITEALEQARIECIVLKGLTHSPGFVPDPLLRGQGDIDLWVRGFEIQQAQQVLTSLGYRSFENGGSRHLPPMLRPNAWKWRGDRFDPEMPVAVELHYQLWSEQTDCIAAPGTDCFWQRSVLRSFGGHCVRALCHQDLLGFAALHLLSHLLHGDLPLQRAWEIANFLHKHSDDETFWAAWRRVHPQKLRNLELIVFQIVRAWFGCALNQVLQGESEALSASVRAWLKTFSFSPLTSQFHPNKDELWLHLELVSPRNRLGILLRRLFPLQIPAFVDEFSDHRKLKTFQRIIRQRKLIASRAAHHLRAMVPVISQGVRWLLLRKS